MNCKTCAGPCALKGSNHEGDCEGYKPMTHYEQIRAMSVEEMAEWIETIADCRMCKIDEGHCSGSGLNSRASCMIKWLDWLRQEATDD